MYDVSRVRLSTIDAALRLVRFDARLHEEMFMYLAQIRADSRSKEK